MITLCGWQDNKDEVEKFQSSLEYQAIPPNYNGHGEGKDIFLWQYQQQVIGHVITHAQTRPDCVTHGLSGAIEVKQCVDIAIGRRNPDTGQVEPILSQFEEVASEPIYGQVHYLHQSYGAGLVVAWAIDYLNKYGYIPRKKYNSIDLSQYSGSNVDALNRRGKAIPDELIEESKKHPLLTYIPITTYTDARDIIAGGGLVVAGSNQGFNTDRDEQGFCKPRGVWPHCTFWDGCSDSSKRPGLEYRQSWGPGMPGGPRKVTLPSGLSIEMPEGAFLVDADVFENKIARAGECYGIIGITDIEAPLDIPFVSY